MTFDKLDVREVSVAKLDPNPWNPNRMDDRTMEATRESIAKHGFIAPVTVREHPDRKGRFQIIDGEHRWKVAQEMKAAAVPVVVIAASDVEAKKLTIILNETRGQADTAELGMLLAEIRPELGDELGVGLRWTESELDSILAVAQDDWSSFDPDGLNDTPPADGDFTTLQIRVPDDFLPLWEQAHEAIGEDADLDPDRRVANGQVVMRVVRSFLGEKG